MTTNRFARVLSRRFVFFITAILACCSPAALSQPAGNSTLPHGDAKDSLEHYERALRDARQSGNGVAISSALRLLGTLQREQGNYDTSLAYLEEALAVSRGGGDKSELAASLLSIGLIRHDLGRPAEALEAYHESLALYEAAGDKRNIARVLNNIALINLDRQKYAPARQQLQRVVTLFESLGDRKSLIGPLKNLGLISSRQKRPGEALEYFRKCKALGEELGATRELAEVLDDIAGVLSGEGKLREAMLRHQESLALRRKDRDKHGIALSLGRIAGLHARAGRYDAAIAAGTEAYDLAKKSGAMEGVLDASMALSLSYAARGDFENASVYQAEYSDIQDSLFHAANRIGRVVETYEAEKRERQIATLEKQAQFQKHMLILMLTGICALGVLSVLLYNRYRYKKRTTEELTGTLKELRRAQAQLVQSEKMASLGQLTSGIAHEIKNPLNFVNNFAKLTQRLSNELGAFLMEWRDKPVKEIEDDLDPMLDDLKSNCERIREHGMKADGIVRSMMQHSREGGGTKQPTDITPVLDQAVDLAFHSLDETLQARIAITRSYDTSVGTLEIISQDISRVMINVMNNALYAVLEKMKTAEPEFAPAIHVHTRATDAGVEIFVRDNGAGIPEDVREKVFLPFFTTKPTGTATGLGLSLSYDIVVQGHAGTIRFETRTNEWTEFIFFLPVTKNAPEL